MRPIVAALAGGALWWTYAGYWWFEGWRLAVSTIAFAVLAGAVTWGDKEGTVECDDE